MGNGEHLLAARRSDEIGPRLRECHAPLVGIERVADADLQQLSETELVAQRTPDVAGLLRCQRSQQVEAERRIRDCSIDLTVKGLFEPTYVVAIDHGVCELEELQPREFK